MGGGGRGGGYDDNSGLRPARSSESKIDSRKYSIIGRYPHPPSTCRIVKPPQLMSRTLLPRSRRDLGVDGCAPDPPRLCSKSSTSESITRSGEIKPGAQQLPARSMEETLPRFHSGPLLNLSDGGIVGTTGFQASSTRGRWSWTLKLAQRRP